MTVRESLFNVKLAQRFVRLLARLRERIEVRESVARVPGIAGFIIRGGTLAIPVRCRE